MGNLAEIRQRFDEHQIEALLITSDQNRRYLTGFTGSSGVVLISKTDQKLITDFRYTEQAKEQAKGFDITLHKKNVAEVVGDLINSMGIKRLGIEKDHLTYREFLEYSKAIEAELVPTSQFIEDLRMVKNEEEISKY
jgi:Xaa-Pro aminopeptidase